MTSALRIVHVVTTEAFAGTERYVSEVSRELAARGHRVTVVGGHPELMPAACGPQVTWLAGPSVRAAAKTLWRLGRQDILHAHLTAAETAVLLAGGGRGGKFVATRHIAARRGSSPAGALLAPVIRRGLDLQLAISEFVASAVDGPSQIIHNGVPLQDRRARHRDGPILICQRLEAEKDTATALRAWAESTLMSSGRRLRIAGTGAEARALQQLARELGVDQSVDFLGHVTDVASEMLNAGALLATAPAEPLGLTVLEAMSFGLPVIAAAGGGHLETVGSVDGTWLFASHDAAACRQALDRYHASAESLEAYEDELARVQRSRFSLPQHVDRLLEVYRS